VIKPKHLEAALALWGYCEHPACFIFASLESNSHAQRIIEALKGGPKTPTEIHKHFSGKLKARQLHRVINELLARGAIESRTIGTEGKPRTEFILLDGPEIVSRT
jgi:hypothetical protein